MKVSKLVRRLLMRALKSALGFTVWVAWGLEQFTHYAWSFAEALAWVACYPPEAYAVVSAGGFVVARRGAL